VSPSQGLGVTMETMPPAQSTGQESDGTAGALTRTELNVLQTMIAIIICFIVCWAPASLASVFQTMRVCKFYIHEKEFNLCVRASKSV